MLMLLSISACKMTPGIPIDPRIDDKTKGYANEAKLYNNHIIYVWLPPAKADKFLPYTESFDLDVQNYATQNGLNNLHSMAQARFNESAGEVGGLFEKRSGRLNAKNLNAALNLTIDKIRAEKGSDNVVVFLTPYEELVKVIDGAHIWHNTYQSTWDHSSNSQKNLKAISLLVNYHASESSAEGLILGLDLEDPRFISEGKYRYLVAHIFDQITKAKVTQ